MLYNSPDRNHPIMKHGFYYSIFSTRICKKYVYMYVSLMKAEDYMKKYAYFSYHIKCYFFLRRKINICLGSVRIKNLIVCNKITNLIFIQENVSHFLF